MNKYILMMGLLVLVDFGAMAMEPKERTKDIQGGNRNTYGNSPIMRVQLRNGEIAYYQNGQRIDKPKRVRRPRRKKLEQVVEESDQSKEETTDTGYDEEI